MAFFFPVIQGWQAINSGDPLPCHLRAMGYSSREYREPDFYPCQIRDKCRICNSLCQKLHKLWSEGLLFRWSNSNCMALSPSADRCSAMLCHGYYVHVHGRYSVILVINTVLLFYCLSYCAASISSLNVDYQMLSFNKRCFFSSFNSGSQWLLLPDLSIINHDRYCSL